MGDSQTKQFGNQYVDKLQGQLNMKAPVFNKSLFIPAGQTTQNAWWQGNKSADQLIAGGGLTGGQQGAMAGTKALGGQYGDLGEAYDPNSAAYKTLRQGVIDDTLTNVGSGFTASGRFGGGSYIDSASKGVGSAVAGLDYNNMQTDINNQYRSLDSQKGIYDTLFGQGQQGLMNKNDALGQKLAIGAGQDANRTGQRLGEYDWWNRKNNAELDRLLKIGSGFGGGAVDAANQAPWWQQILGYAAGAFGNS